jgi:hypothetical protein
VFQNWYVGTILRQAGSLENLEILKYLGKAVTVRLINQNYLHDEITNGLNLGNV